MSFALLRSCHKVIDSKTETVLTFAEASKRLRTRPDISTLHRWRQRGIRNQKLETLLVGGRRCTSIEALERFFAAATAAGVHVIDPMPAVNEREVQIRAAENELDANEVRIPRSISRSKETSDEESEPG
jgi:hypothetical protein